MPDPVMVSFLLKVPALLDAEIRVFRHTHRLASRTEALRVLLRLGLAAAGPAISPPDRTPCGERPG